MFMKDHMVLELMSRSHEDDHHGAGQVWTASMAGGNQQCHAVELLVQS